MDFNSAAIRQLISLAITEDLGEGDHSSLSALPDDLYGVAYLSAKSEGIICGLPLLPVILAEFGYDINLHFEVEEGAKLNPGQKIGELRGKAQQLLTAERTILNFIQRLSGIATYTRHLCQLIEHTNCRLLDTRKTTPGFRSLEKYAVTIGGGANHRHGLYDMIMLKDNHIDFCGGITRAVEKTNAYLKAKGLKLPVEVETRNEKEAREALQLQGVTRIMLDNFTPEELKLTVELIGNKKETEASGGITEANIVSYAETGVQFISVGALTHSVKSLDISMKVQF